MAMTKIWHRCAGLSAIGLAIILVFSTAAIINSAVFVVSYFSVTPFWDIWSWVADYKSYFDGHYTLQDLLKPHNEHRIVTTRLLLFLDAFWFNMTGKFVVASNFAILGLIGTMLGVLAAPPRQHLWVRSAFIVPAIAWTTSTCQWINLITPFQVQFTLLLLAILMASAALAAATDGESQHEASLQSAPGLPDFGRRVCWAITAGLFYCLATFSMAGGLLAMPPLLLLLVLRRSTRGPCIAFLTTAILTALLFLYHYKPFHAEPMTLPSDLVTILLLLRFAAQFLGNAFVAVPALPLAAGVIGVLVYGVALVTVLNESFRSDKVSSSLLLVPFTTAGAVIIIAASAAVSRASGGIEGSLEPRYASVSLVFSGCIACVAVQLGRKFLRGHSRASTAAAGIAGGLFLAGLAVCNMPRQFSHNARFFANGMEAAGDSLRRNVYVPATYGRMIYGVPRDLSDRLDFLRQERLSVFAPGAEDVPPDNLIALSRSPASEVEICSGRMDYAYREDATRFVIRGYVASDKFRRSADWIALYSGDKHLLDVLPASEYRNGIDISGHHVRNGHGVSSGFLDASAGGEQQLNLTAVGLFAGSVPFACAYPSQISIGPIRVQAPASIVDVRSIQTDTKFQPASTFRPSGVTSATPFKAPFADEPIFASAAAGDAAKGAVKFLIRPGASDDIVIPFATGPDPGGQSIEIDFNDGSTARLAIPGDTGNLEWRVATLPSAVIAQHGGAPIVIVARDDGDGWGQWLAVGAPKLAHLTPDWARLY